MEKVFSESIANWCNFVTEAANELRSAKDEMDRLEALTQDYLHALELGDLNYKERAKIATKLAVTRKERRVAKDEVEVLEQFVIFCEEKDNRAYMNKLREILGKMRTSERKQKNRMYTPRVMQDGADVFSKGKEKA